MGKKKMHRQAFWSPEAISKTAGLEGMQGQWEKWAGSPRRGDCQKGTAVLSDEVENFFAPDSAPNINT